jgi:hypothetical protein
VENWSSRGEAEWVLFNNGFEFQERHLPGISKERTSLLSFGRPKFYFKFGQCLFDSNE